MGGAGHRFWLLAAVALCWSVVATALSIVSTSHQCRQSFAALQDLQARQWQLQEQRGKLLLQESTLAAHQRVEGLARRELGMRLPTLNELEVVLP